MASTFVDVPTDRLLGRLTEIGSKIQDKGGTWEIGVSGSEKVFTARIHDRPEMAIKVYTSIGAGEDSARDCGEDAIRILVGRLAGATFRPLREGVTFKRTAPNNVPDRVGALLDRLTEALREAYTFGRGVPTCSKCGQYMALRQGPKGKFWGCLGYPECRGTKNYEETKT